MNKVYINRIYMYKITKKECVLYADCVVIKVRQPDGKVLYENHPIDDVVFRFLQHVLRYDTFRMNDVVDSVCRTYAHFCRGIVRRAIRDFVKHQTLFVMTGIS